MAMKPEALEPRPEDDVDDAYLLTNPVGPRVDQPTLLDELEMAGHLLQ